MTALVNTISIRNAGTRVTGLTPTWAFFKKLSDNSDISSPPAITEVAQGVYKFSYDPEGAGGEAVGQIDAGGSVSAAADRYIDVLLAADASKVFGTSTAVGNLSGLPSAVGALSGVPAAVGALSGLPAAVSALPASISNVPAAVDTALTAAHGSGAWGGSGGGGSAPTTQQIVTALLGATVPNVNTPGTVADALNAARAQGFGKWVLDGVTLTLYGADNTTPVRVFTVDDAAAPTRRT